MVWEMILMVWLAALAKLHGELRMNKFKEAMHRHTQRNNGHYRMSEVNQDYSNLVPGTALRGACVCACKQFWSMGVEH